jgi:hypothetical protein
MVGGTRTRRGNSSSVLSHTVAPRRRVPAVYLAHAIRAIVAILAVRGMNNLRASNTSVGSNPTRASNLHNELITTSSSFSLCPTWEHL